MMNKFRPFQCDKKNITSDRKKGRKARTVVCNLSAALSYSRPRIAVDTEPVFQRPNILRNERTESEESTNKSNQNGSSKRYRNNRSKPIHIRNKSIKQTPLNEYLVLLHITQLECSLFRDLLSHILNEGEK